MTSTTIMDGIYRELVKDKIENPRLPQHIVARAGMLQADAGGVMQEAIVVKYDKRYDIVPEDQRKALKKAAERLAAKAIRFLQSLEKEGQS